jgi:hypothetical protein
MDIIIIAIIALTYFFNMMKSWNVFDGVNINLNDFTVEEVDDSIPCLEWEGETSNTVFYSYLVSTGCYGVSSVSSDISFGRSSGMEASPRMWVYGSYVVEKKLKFDILKGTIEEKGRANYIDLTTYVKVDYRGDTYGEMKLNPRWNTKRLIREEIKRVKSLYNTHCSDKKSDNRCKKGYKHAYRNW